MDAFTVLDLPQSAALSEEQVRAAYFEKCKAEDADRAALNAAYELLLTPDKRLRHLLDIAAPEAARQWRTVTMREDLMQLFMALGRVRPEAEALIHKRSQTQSTLTRALTERQALQLRETLEGIGAALDDKRQALETELSSISPDDWQTIAEAQARFAYLAKWQAQVRELLLKLM